MFARRNRRRFQRQTLAQRHTESLEKRQLLSGDRVYADLYPSANGIYFGGDSTAPAPNPDGVFQVYADTEFTLKTRVWGTFYMKETEAYTVRVEGFGQTLSKTYTKATHTDPQLWRLRAKPQSAEIRVTVIPHFADPNSANNTTTIAVQGLTSQLIVDKVVASEIVAPLPGNYPVATKPTVDIWNSRNNQTELPVTLFDSFTPHEEFNRDGIEVRIEGLLRTSASTKSKIDVSWVILGENTSGIQGDASFWPEIKKPTGNVVQPFSESVSIPFGQQLGVGHYSLTLRISMLNEAGEETHENITVPLSIIYDQELINKSAGQQVRTHDADRMTIAIDDATRNGNNVKDPHQILTSLMEAVWHKGWEYDLHQTYGTYGAINSASQRSRAEKLLFGSEPEKSRTADCNVFAFAWHLLANTHGIDSRVVDYEPKSGNGRLLMQPGLRAPGNLSGNAQESSSTLPDRFIFRQHGFGYSQLTGALYDPTFNYSVAYHLSRGLGEPAHVAGELESVGITETWAAPELGIVSAWRKSARSEKHRNGLWEYSTTDTNLKLRPSSKSVTIESIQHQPGFSARGHQESILLKISLNGDSGEYTVRGAVTDQNGSILTSKENRFISTAADRAISLVDSAFVTVPVSLMQLQEIDFSGEAFGEIAIIDSDGHLAATGRTSLGVIAGSDFSDDSPKLTGFDWATSLRDGDTIERIDFLTTYDVASNTTLQTSIRILSDGKLINEEQYVDQVSPDEPLEISLVPPRSIPLDSAVFAYSVSSADGRLLAYRTGSLDGKNESNRPPVIAPVPNQDVIQNESLTVGLTVSDPDGDELTLIAEVVNPDALAQLAWELDQELELRPRNADYSAGLSSTAPRYFWGKDSVYYININGELYRYIPADQDQFIAQLDRSYFDNPEKLDRAENPTTEDIASATVSGEVLNVRPAEDFVGTFTVHVTATDGKSSTKESFSVTVEEPSPMLAAIESVRISSYTEIEIERGDGANSWEGIILSGRSSNSSVIKPSRIRFGGGHSYRTLQITPEPGQSGETLITLSAFDTSTGISHSTTFHVTVDLAANSAPTLTPPRDVTLIAGGSTTIPVEASDPDGDELELSIQMISSEGYEGHVAAAIADGQIELTADQDFAGSVEFEVTVSDGQSEGSATFRVVSVAAPEALLPFNASSDENAAWMLGSVHVSVVAFESDGSLDPNLHDWSEADRKIVKQSVDEAVGWWSDTLASFNSVHDLNFSVDYTYLDNPITTQFEPRWRTYDRTFRVAMMEEFLDETGISLRDMGSAIENVNEGLRRFSHRERQENGANWAFTIFVTDSFRNEGGFHGNQISGARTNRAMNAVMMYGYADQSKNPPEFQNFNHVVAHEIGHIFAAQDEYHAVPIFYHNRSGVYDTQNLNSRGAPDPENHQLSIMDTSKAAFEQHAISTSAAAMVGWQDTDGDGVFDVLDQPHELVGSGKVTNNVYQFTGQSFVTLFDELDASSLYTNNLTINTIDIVEYRLNSGEWRTAATYQGYATDVGFELNDLPPGEYTIEIRTRDVDSPKHLEHGITSNIISEAFNISDKSSVGQLSWAKSDSAETYEVWINDAASNSLIFREAGLTKTVLTVPALPDGKYVYWIQDETPGGTGTWRTRQVFAVRNGVISNRESPGIISWNADTEAVTYEIWVNSATTGSLADRQAGLASAQYQLPLLEDGEYYYWIQSETHGGDGSWSDRKTFKVVDGKLSDDSGSPGSLTWDLDTPHSFEVWINDAVTNQMILRLDGLTERQLILPALANGRYLYWIQSEDGNGNGQWSERREFTISAGKLETESLPVGNLTWAEDPAAVTYEIWINDSLSGTVTVRESGLEETVFVVPQLADGEYEYWIQSESAGGDGDWSQKQSFTVENGSIQSQQSVGALSWSPDGTAVTYELWVSREGEGNQPVLREAGLSNPHYVLPQLADGVYDYWIQYENNTGNGTWSEKMSFEVVGGQLFTSSDHTSFLVLDTLAEQLAKEGLTSIS